MKLYRSQAVADAGAEAIAQGNEIAFAPGMTDFHTKSGQERLGHELSHVMSQRSGQVRGSGFLNDSSLKARADREGAMAAAGQQVYAQPVNHTLSTSAPSPFAAGSMQAKRANEMAPPQMQESQDIQLLDTPKLPSRDEIEAIKRRKQAVQNVDRLYSIRGALMAGKEGKSHVSEEDMEWYEDMQTNADLDTYKEIYSRHIQSARDLVKYRDALQDTDPNKRNFEASWSDPALNIDVYNSIAATLASSPGAEKFQMELQEKEMKRMAEGGVRSEDFWIDQEAGVIRDANSPEVRTKRTSYLQTEAGQKEYALREPIRNKRYLELALSKMKKKK